MMQRFQNANRMANPGAGTGARVPLSAVRRGITRVFRLLRLATLPTVIALFTGAPHAQQQPDQNCVATMENRSVPLDQYGSYVIPNVPVNPGMYRARVVCAQPDGTVLGSTTPYTVLTPNGSTALPAMAIGTLSYQPAALKVQVISGALSSVGATVQLETQAYNPTDFSTNPAFTAGSFAYDYTQLTEGTTYTSSNTAVATVDNNGVVTAVGPGVVYITSRNDGLASTIQLTSFGLLDSDGDGIPDAFEIANGLNPYDPTDAALDPDNDGLTNLQEFQLGTNPHIADTDGDGLNDGDEVKIGTNPLVADTDGDGLIDGDEVRLGTNPLNPDTDGDGIPDGVEVKIGTNPLVADVTTNVVGHVTQPNGTPYPAAAVVSLSYFTGQTDSTGAFSLLHVPVTLGNILVSAQAIVGAAVYNGASNPTAPVGNGTTDVGTIQLGQSAGQVSGTILSPDNKPVAGAQVTVADGSDVRTTITDGSGIYVVTGLQMGAVSVAAFDPATSLRGQGTGMLSGNPLTLNVTLAAFGTVSGTVSDATGTPVGKGVSVTISGALNTTTTTDTLGHYSFQFVPLGGYQVDATDTNGNHGRSNGTITATSQTINANVQFLGRGTVTGTVSDSQGHAAAGAAITLLNQGVFFQQLTTTTNSLGQYTIANVFVGNVSVAAVLAASNTSANATGNLSANAQTLTLNLTLQPTANLAGTVFRRDGATPVSGAVITLNNTGFTATTNSAGQYSLANIPLGNYTLMAVDPSSTDRGSASVSLSNASQTVTANVNMVGVGTVVVTVVDGSGATVSGASVTVSGGSPFGQNQSAVTGSNGTATVNQQLAGSVTVNATNPGTGLGGTATATVTAGSSVAVTVMLQPSGSITGTVYQHDATTPVAGATVVLDASGQRTLTNAAGVYTFNTVPTGSHNAAVLDIVGNILAVNNSVTVASQGQVVTANFVIIGRGTVTGHVTFSDGSAAPGSTVQLTSNAAGDANPYGNQADVNGLYTTGSVPVGSYKVIAQFHQFTYACIDASSGQTVGTTTSIFSNITCPPPDSVVTVSEKDFYGTATGAVASDGQTVTTDVQISQQIAPSNVTYTDGNGFTYPIHQNGGIYDGSFTVFAGDASAHEGGSLLNLLLNGSTTPFTGAPLANNGAIEQDGIDGLNVVRKVYVPADGYFARYLELLSNPTASNITVGVQLNSFFRSANEFYKVNGVTQLNAGTPHILQTSSGDTVLNVNDPTTPDNWVTLGGPGDRDPFMQDQFADTPVPAIADVFSGPGAALAPSSASYAVDPSGSFSTLTENYATVTVPAGGTVGILHFISQENEYSASNASAARLVQLPPEALAGLTNTDIAAIANFAVPAGGTSAVAALPSLDGQVTGFVYASDGATIVPGAIVHLQSTDPIYARTYVTTADGNSAAYSFQGSYGGMAIPEESYKVYATDPTVSTPLTPECAQNGHYNGSGCAIDSPAVTGTFDASNTQSSTNINFTNTGILTGTISRGPTVLNVSGTVTVASSLTNSITLPIAADGTYTVRDLPPGTYNVLAQVTNTLLSGTGSGTIVAGQTTTTNINIEPAGSVQGTVTRADGSLAVNDVVNLRATGAVLQAVVDTSGHYAFTDIPTGTYTVDVYDSQSNSAASASIVVSSNATATQNLTLQSTGTVSGAVTTNDGSSVIGLSVTLTSTTTGGTQNLSTTTDSAGKFTFTGVTPGTIMLHTATAAGLQGSASSALPLAGQSITINIALTSIGNVTGTVFQGDGTTPAAGIQVTISPAPLTGSATTTTNSNGVYSFSNEAFGPFTVYASNTANNDRGQTSSQIQANGQLRTVNITLTGFGTLIVKVIDSSNNVVPNASVTLTDNSAGTNSTATSDSTGSATFSNILAGTFQVFAKDPVSGLQAQTSGTLAYNATQTITLTLQAVGTIQGTVYGTDGTTPQAGATVQLNAPYGPSTTTASNGSYLFADLSVGGSYSIQARDVSGLPRAQVAAQILQTSGQIITQNLTFVGVGGVTGVVTNPDGSRAENMTVQLISKNSTVPSTQNATTGGDGTYSVAEVPVGSFSVTVLNLPSNLAGFTTGNIKNDGDQEAANIQIQSSTVSLPTTLTDADGFLYPIQSDGRYASGATALFGVYPFYSAEALQVNVSGNVSSFGDNSSPTTAIQSLSGEQVEINQPSLQGLNVTRKIYVPSDGYFARRLEVLQNPTSSPITVTVTLTGTDRYSTLSPQVVTTSNGNTTVDKTILWAVDDDDSGNTPYPASQPAHANVFAGAGASIGMNQVSQSVYNYGGYYNQPAYSLEYWTYTYNPVTIPAGGTASFLFFTAQEATASTATTAARRLEQLPAEALSGLTTSDLSNVVNFVVPATPLTAIHPPATSASIVGVVQTGDGSLPIPNAIVYAQSTDLEYGSGASTTADARGNYGTSSLTTGSYAVEAVDPATNITSPTFTGNITAAANPQNAQTQNILFTNTGILSGQVKATGNGSIGMGTIDVYVTCYPATGSSVACGTAAQTYGTDGSFQYLTIPAGSQRISASVSTPTGGYIYLPQQGGTYIVNVTAKQTTQFVFTIPASGNITGTITNADGTPASGVTVYATPSNYNQGTPASVKTAANGTYTMTELLLDTYTISATDPATGSTVSQTTTLMQDATNTVNLQFVGKGSVVATVKYADGNTAQGVTVYISTSSTPNYVYGGTTDSNGQFTFNNVPAGTFSVRAYYPNQPFYSTTTGSVTGNGNTVQLAVSLTPVGTISGTLTYANGTPVAQQYVYAKDAQNIYSSYAQTDSAGNYALTPVPADRTINLSSTYYDNTLNKNVTTQAANQQVPGDGQTLTVNLRFPGAATVKVTVLQSDGTPYASGGYVNLKSNDGSQTYSGSIGSDGTSTFTNVLEGTFVAYANLNSEFNVGSKVFTVGSANDGTTVNVTINTSLSGTVQGQVFAADGTTVIRDGYSVKITDVDANTTNEADPTGGAGYSFTNVQVGASGFSLTAALDANSTISQSATGNITSSGQVITQNFTLPVSSISGTVFLYDGVTPVPNANISVNQSINGSSMYYSTTTDANGTYQISGPVTGSFTLRASDNNGVLGTAAVTLPSDTSIVSGVNVNLGATGTVVGVAYSSTSQLLANVNVEIQSSGNNGGFSTEVTTDANGNFSATDIPLGNITVSTYDNTSSQELSATGALNNNGDTVTINLGNVPPPQTNEVFGTVYDANQNPALGATVTVTPADQTAQAQTATTDSNGLYSVGSLPVGSVTVSAVLADGTQAGSTTGAITDPQTPVEIDVGLQNPGVVSGVVLDSSGNPVPNANINCASSGDTTTSEGEGTGSDGSFYFPGIAPGIVTLTVTDNSGNVLGTANGTLPYGGNLTLNVKFVATSSMLTRPGAGRHVSPSVQGVPYVSLLQAPATALQLHVGGR